MGSQIVFVRELLSAFAGDELSIGIVLAAWLFTGALGSFACAMWAGRIGQEKAARLLPLLLTAGGLYLPAGILAAQSLRSWVGLVPGEAVPLVPLAVICLLIVLPLCGCLGSMFGLASRLSPDEEEKSMGMVYALESAGSVFGGAAVSFILARFFSGLEIAGILGAVACLCALTAVRPRARYGLAVIAFVMLGCVPAGIWQRLNVFALERSWPGYSVAFTGNSIYGSTVVLGRGTQLSFLDNGNLIASVPDEQAAEESVHFCLLEHPRPRSVLLLGGGAAGLLPEILKHGVERVDYAELDPQQVNAARRLLPPGLSGFDDPRVSVHMVDGRYFVGLMPEEYDCVVIRAGDPSTAMGNRFFTREFFLKLRQAMKDDAVLSFGMPASESFLNRPTRAFLRSVYASLGSVFPRIVAIPGETAWFVAGSGEAALTTDYSVLMTRMRERGIELKYVREYYLSTRMSGDKLAWFSGELASGSAVPENRDFHPSAYYYRLISSLSRFRDSSLALILEAAWKNPWLFMGVFVILVLLPGIVPMNGRITPAFAALSAGGFGALAFQVILMFCFQMLYGYLYYQIGLLFTCFMAGLFAGSRLMAEKSSSGRLPLILLLACSAAFYSILPTVFGWLSVTRVPWQQWMGSHIVFSGFSIIAGLLSGMQFVLAGRAGARPEEKGRASAISYGFDLWGSCLGALLTGFFLIPVAGVASSCFFIATIYAIALLLLRFVL